MEWNKHNGVFDIHFDKLLAIIFALNILLYKGDCVKCKDRPIKIKVVINLNNSRFR